MISVTAEFKAHLSKILKDGELSKRFFKGMNDSKYIVEGEYRKEAPVNDSLLRNQISSKDIPGGFITTTNAKSADGKPYPIYISGGTGKFKGQQDGGYTTGRTRIANYTNVGKSAFKTLSKEAKMKDIGFFMILAKMGKRNGKQYLSIRPNKFAVRAEKNSKNTVVEVFVILVDKLSRELIDVK